ncbi:MAG: hypothetical protein IJZ47_00225 [Oscillospiraceae bacterium]|nr:hypothetical protein [Oscillospiraceae bacterium]
MAATMFLLSLSGCLAKSGYVSDKSETQELQWLAEELQLVCDEVESVVCSDRVRYSHNANVTALVVNFRHEIDEEQAEEVVEQLLCQFNNTQLLDILLSHGWFKDQDAVIVFYSGGKENDYIFELLWCHDYIKLFGPMRFWAKNDCFEHSEWELADYIDIDSYLAYIGLDEETIEA